MDYLKKVAATGIGTGIYKGLTNVESEESRRESVATGEDVNKDSRAMESELRKLEEID